LAYGERIGTKANPAGDGELGRFKQAILDRSWATVSRSAQPRGLRRRRSVPKYSSHDWTFRQPMGLRGRPVVVLQYPAEPLATFDRTGRAGGFLTSDDQAVGEPLMVPLSVVMREEFRGSPSERRLPEEDHAVQAFALKAPHEALQMGVGQGCRVHPMRRLSANVSVSPTYSTRCSDTSST
jgi:hypothetical protein